MYASYSKLSKELKMVLEFKKAKRFLSYCPKQYFDCSDPYLKNHLAY